MNYKRKSRRRVFLLVRSRTPPISSEFRGGGMNTPNPPLSVRHCSDVIFVLRSNNMSLRTAGATLLTWTNFITDTRCHLNKRRWSEKETFGHCIFAKEFKLLENYCSLPQDKSWTQWILKFNQRVRKKNSVPTSQKTQCISIHLGCTDVTSLS